MKKASSLPEAPPPRRGSHYDSDVLAEVRADPENYHLVRTGVSPRPNFHWFHKRHPDISASMRLTADGTYEIWMTVRQKD